MTDLSKLVPLEEAQQTILAQVGHTLSETIALEHAHGRTIAANLTSDIDVAPFNNSAMDGFCFRAADVEQASENTPVHLSIVAYVPAGSFWEGEVQDGQCVRIMTGAAMPAGADTVEKIESVTFTGSGMEGDELVLDHTVALGKNVRNKGEEVPAGGLVLEAGTTLNAAAMGLLASTGNVEIPVHAKPVVGILSLGSELVGANQIPAPGQIRNSNAYALAECATRAGATPKTYPILPDNYETIKAALSQAIAECDFVVSSGGAGAGDFDFITEIANDLGEVFFKYVNMRPGKAQTFAVIQGTPFLGLAGNPAAAICGFEMLVYPALQKMQGRSTLFHPVQKASLASNIKKKDPRLNFQRATLERSEAGRLVATPYKNQSSALFGVFQKSDCLVTVPAGVEFIEAGSEVDCVRIDIPSGTVV